MCIFRHVHENVGEHVDVDVDLDVCDEVDVCYERVCVSCVGGKGKRRMIVEMSADIRWQTFLCKGEKG